jgi:scyllo-inositol 2-dehydrogenase (NADP+)
VAEEIRAGIIGYGGAFNMGKHHAESINREPGMRTIAICDIDAARREAAKRDFPDVDVYEDYREMLKRPDLDLCVVVLPHNLHASVAIECSRAGKHVITEKPMCITTAEATAMIEAARAAGKMLTTYHNRRHDGDYQTLKRIVRGGLLGDVFRVEMFGGGYGHPGYWWRSDKKVSGGHFYDWGAHYLDWLLGIVPSRVSEVRGFFRKLRWFDVTNEDDVHALIVFENGVTADVQMSTVARIGKPRWRVWGTLGAAEDVQGAFRVETEWQGQPTSMSVRFQESRWANFYHQLADHLLRGGPLDVKPEHARRVIAIMEAAERSSQSGRPEPVPYEDTIDPADRLN